MPNLVKFLDNDVIIGHNVTFDIKFLVVNMHNRRYHVPFIKYVDTLSMARKYIKGLNNYKLPTLKEHLNINATSHLADQDCYVCAEVYKYCMSV